MLLAGFRNPPQAGFRFLDRVAIVSRELLSNFEVEDKVTMFFSKIKKISSTPFSKFIREASSAEKKRVYTDVLKKASESQNRVVERHSQAVVRNARSK